MKDSHFSFESRLGIIYGMEVKRLLRSRRLKLMTLLMFLPVVVYFFTHEEITEYSTRALRISFQVNFSTYLVNFWASVIGQLVVIILMSELLGSEIDKGTIRVLLTKPVRKSELVIGKFLGGLTGMLVVFGLPYLVMQIYMVLLYKQGFTGLRATFGDLLYSLEVTILLLGSLGAFAMALSVVLSRPLYASLASFGVIFVAQFILPQLPFFDDPERFTLNYQLGVLLRDRFTLHTGLDVYKGDPSTTLVFFASVMLLSLMLAILGLYRREYRG
ncbi:ABC transporter permease [Thermococcus kodakarensis]|nr:ABC transporter permease [Thermococcus kodakarensis]WCN29097.1 ABC transporter permease [Thermococcus kodakarensis]WCN31401.1 ABC transporter permease [Thermococcus kodakarensis]